jgi:hypothetical protein
MFIHLNGFKLKPLTCINFKSKVQLSFAHIKCCDKVINVF